jgi:hypothetical protein
MGIGLLNAEYEYMHSFSVNVVWLFIGKRDDKILLHLKKVSFFLKMNCIIINCNFVLELVLKLRSYIFIIFNYVCTYISLYKGEMIYFQ